MKIVIERHPDGYVACALGLKGVVVGQADTYEAALADVNSAIRFHIEVAAPKSWRRKSPVPEAYISEGQVA